MCYMRVSDERECEIEGACVRICGRNCFLLMHLPGPVVVVVRGTATRGTLMRQ